MSNASSESSEKTAFRLLPPTHDRSTIAFAISLIFLLSFASMVWGMLSFRYHLFPYSTFKAAFELYSNMEASGSPAMPALQIAEVPIPEDMNGVTIFERDEAMPGINFVTGLFDDSLRIRILDMEGRIINDWPIKWSVIWPDTDHLDEDDIPKTDLNAEIHGAILMPNGDIVFNFEELGLVRLDQCGKVVWRLAHPTHHSISVAEDGNLWVPSAKWHTSRIKEIPHVRPPINEPTVLEISPDGRIVREISLLPIFIKNDLFGLLYSHSNGSSGPVSGGNGIEVNGAHLFHLNDVERYPEALANLELPFMPGDLMVSFRNLNTVLIFDPDDLQLKWLRSGTFFRQHDPDFRTDGKISLLDNNNRELPDGSQQSRILIFDFGRNRWDVIYEGSDGVPFFTSIRGKHQWLENGNLLITEAQSARAFEINPNGEVVWELVNNIGGGRGGVMTQVDRYDIRYREAFGESTCKPKIADRRF